MVKRNFFVTGCYIFSFLFLLQENVSAQCVLINEILANGPGACDGNCNPNTEEWTELYNTCVTPADISCYVMTDGDFTVTIPAGTIIPANGYFVIGSINSGGTIDIDLATCGCTSGSGIGTFTNSGEQIILLDPTGNIVDAVYWGAGQFPVSIIAPAINGCSSVTVNVPAATASFSALPIGGANGCSVARVCDGASTWEERCGALVSMHSTNGIAAIPDFTVTDSIICTGSCIDFTDLSSGTPTAWSWSFPGSSTGSSTLQNPTNICYPTAGNYDLTLSMTNACGTFTITKTAYIQVSSGQIPVITSNGPVSFCSGGSVLLQTTTVGALQWMLNGVAINGATNQTYTVTASGTYSLNAGSGSCSGVSNTIVVNVISSPVSQITPQGSTTICAGGSVTLDAGAGFTTYQWWNNGAVISGATNQTYTATSAGSFQVVVSNATGCLATSAIVSVTSLSANPPSISSSTGIFSICSGQNLTLSVANTFTTYQWYLNAAIISGATNANYTTST
ncbi:MAG: PKD domain-containing protein, partial [Sphingobacteriales bacterium]